jgi:hypothetical protein
MSLALKIILAIVGLGLLLFLFDRLALAMERRGWIYYRKRKPSSTSLGNAFLSIQSILEPGTEKVIEVRREKKDGQDSGDGPPAGRRTKAEAGRRNKPRASRKRRPARPNRKGGKA